MQILTKIRNWRMERIPEIERPGCPSCKQPMYWNRNRQDWACKPCDDYNFNINAPWNDEDYWDDDDYADFSDDYDDEYPPGYDDYHGPIIG